MTQHQQAGVLTYDLPSSISGLFHKTPGMIMIQGSQTTYGANINGGHMCPRSVASLSIYV